MSRRSVEETVLRMRDTSALMVDLAYSAVFYDSKQIGREVLDLEEDMGESLTELQRGALEAVRDGGLDIGHALVLLRVGQSAEMMANAALEIVDVVLRDVDLHPVLAESIRESDSAVTKVTLAPESDLAGRTLRELELETETGMRVVAVKRDRRWHSKDVDGDFGLQAGDLLIAAGPEESEAAFRQRVEPVPRG